MITSFPFPASYSSDEILIRRAQILNELCAMDTGFGTIPVSSIRPDTLSTMLRLYDERFLNGFLHQAYGKIEVTLSSRLISAAGKFVYTRDARKRLIKAEIRMSGDFLTRLEYGPFSLNGLSAAMPQEAFLIVFEHELCHALEIALYGETGHSRRFLSLANGLFGHTTTTHQLPTRKIEAAQSGIRVGAWCTFIYQDRWLRGQITYVGKTATVMVQSATGDYRDRSGRRYTKYRVPLSQLKVK